MNPRFAVAIVALLASGCATMAPQVMTGDPAQRRTALQSLDDWKLDGRIAVAAGADGFSGGLNWKQRGERAEITLRGPMGGAAILIRIEGTQYVVTDERGVTHDGDDARRFIEEKLGPGSELPIAEMRYWLVGAPAPELPHSETIGEGGLLSHLEQSGWIVGYGRYRVVGSLALPERVEMTTEGLRLRVAISNWRVEP